jgi:hypothetical protein
MPQTKLGTFHDASGKITVAVFERKAANQQAHFHDFACTVPMIWLLLEEAQKQPTDRQTAHF